MPRTSFRSRLLIVLVAVGLAVFARGPNGAGDRGPAFVRGHDARDVVAPSSESLSATPREPRLVRLDLPARALIGPVLTAADADAAPAAFLAFLLVALAGASGLLEAARRAARPRAPPLVVRA